MPSHMNLLWIANKAFTPSSAMVFFPVERVFPLERGVFPLERRVFPPESNFPTQGKTFPPKERLIVLEESRPLGWVKIRILGVSVFPGGENWGGVKLVVGGGLSRGATFRPMPTHGGPLSRVENGFCRPISDFAPSGGPTFL